MKCGVTTFKGITDSSNKRLCLSTLRMLKRCFDCNLYDKCESRIINERYDKLIETRHRLSIEYMNEMEKIRLEIASIPDGVHK